MASIEDAVEVPYCSVCRRSSDVKWRKHVFSKGHQRTAVDFLAVRVASFEVTKAKIAAQSEGVGKLFCVFCEADLESLRHWVKHCASSSHRKKLNDFCKHHRCDAAQQTRQQLCLAAHEADTLLQALDNQERRRDAAQQAPEPATQHAPPTHSTFASSSHIEAFMNTVAARLQDVRSSRAQANQATNGASTSSVAARRQDSQTAPRGVSPAGVKFAHRTTEVAHGSGLGSIRRVDWGEQIANVHSFAVPPWMVDSEEEYKRCNQRSNSSASGKAPKRKLPSSGRDEEEGSDIFSRLKPKYDEATWLPNFGGVWQDGPRSKTRKEFSKALTHEMRNDTEAPHTPQLSLVQPPPLPPPLAPAPPPPAESIAALASVVREVPTIESKGETQAAPSHPVEQTAVSALDAKKSLLLAQKERLRAKLTAKKNAQS